MWSALLENRFIRNLSVVVCLGFGQVAAFGQQSCVNLFKTQLLSGAEVYSQIRPLDPALVRNPVVPFTSLQARVLAVRELENIIVQNRTALPEQAFSVALNLSAKNNLHIATSGLSFEQHNVVSEILLKNRLEKLLSSVPPFLRNKYFEIKVAAATEGQRDVVVVVDFSWRLSFPILSQLPTGFATETTDLVRPYVADEKRSEQKVRMNLINQRRAQNTSATCGPSSITQVLASRKIFMNETQILNLAERMGVKTKVAYFGEDPGISFEALTHVAREIGKKFGFKVRTLTLDTPNLEQELENAVIASLNPKSKTDVILNYYSPVIRRPGSGHYSPVGGYNAATKEILMSETSLAVNPPFWVKLSAMQQALIERGVLIFEWD